MKETIGEYGYEGDPVNGLFLRRGLTMGVLDGRIERPR